VDLEAVAEVLSENCPTLMRRIGVKEQFGQVGTTDYLKKYYKLTDADIVEAVKEIQNQFRD
jgi:transketolase